MSIALVILAAGKGTRMKSDLPKVLHPIGFAPMLAHAMQAGAALKPDRTVVVAGHGAAQVTDAVSGIDPNATVVLQTEQNGTAHAVLQARAALEGFDGDVIVLYGDTPFISQNTLQAMLQARASHDVVVLGFETDTPGRYGRLLVDGAHLTRIVEYKDATAAERAITLCNSGLVACNADTLFSLIDSVSNNNAAEEYYLTDIVELAHGRGLSATAVTCDESETLGINSRADLAAAEAVFQTQARTAMMDAGVTLMDPASVFVALDTSIDRDCVIEPHVVFGPGVTIERNTRIRAFSHLEGCHIGQGATIGPFARLRPGTELAEQTHIGNFVEVKNARVAPGAKINHLSYVGDASVGARTNVGAGTITCNYDGVSKHRTEIGADVFIGSNTMLVAPITIGDGAMTATGTVATKDVAPDALAVARAKQENKPGHARKMFEMLKSKKASRDKEQN